MFSSPLHPNYVLSTIPSDSPSSPDCRANVDNGNSTNNRRRRQKTQPADRAPALALGDITDSSFLNAKCHHEQSSPRQLLTPETTPPTKRAKKATAKDRSSSCQDEGRHSTTSLLSAATLQASTVERPLSLPRRLFVRELTLGCSASRRFYSRVDFCKYELRSYCSIAAHDTYVIQESTGLRQSIPFSVTSCRQHSISAVGGEDGIVHVLDTDVRKAFQQPLMKLACHDNAIFDTSFSPTDTHLATASGDQTARIFDLQRQQCTSILRPCDGHSLKQVKFLDTPLSRNPAIVATSTRGGTISLFDTRIRTDSSAESLPVAQIMRAQNPEKGRRATKSTHARSVTSLAFLDENTLLSAGESSGSIREWDLRKTSLEKKYLQPVSQTVGGDKDHGVTSIAVDYYGARVWTLSKSGAVFAYPLGQTDGCEAMECIRDPQLKVDSFYVKLSVASEEAVHRAGLNGGYIACGSSENVVVVLPVSRRGCGDLTYMRMPSRTGSKEDFVTRERRVAAALVNGHSKEVTGVSWTCDGEIISIGDDMLVRRWKPHRDISNSESIREAMRPRMGRKEIIPEDEMDGFAEYEM
ncbi:WD40-repeat-containing domain protein [Lipomyces kononenkoae]|uniref:WD40-repeat-containing domain protein n=1 Tax=Lipomyces kononenkoae TaxID=34357 RepID=A0ACC3T9C6_LIPKO